MSGENVALLSWNICRCCGIEKNIGVNLCGPDNARKNRLSKIISLLPKEIIHLDSIDELPKFICTDCEITLNHFSEFCEMVKKTQQTLKLQSESNRTRITKKPYSEEKSETLHCHTLGSTSSTKTSITILIEGDGKIKCEVCGYLLTYAELTALELPTFNLGTIVCVCQLCGHRGNIASFQNKNNTVCCTNCYFVGYKQSDTSVQNAKQLKKIHQCNICSKTFRCKSHCDRHKMTHSGAKPFLCETCGTGFNQKKSLKLHMLSHSGINPFVCKWCGQTFRFKVSLESHIINIHSVETDKRKIECDRCKKQFATKYKLFRHHRSHTGMRPYKCDLCSKYFSQTGNLRAHLKKHKMDSFSKSIESQTLIESESLKSLGTIFDEHCPQRKDFLNLEQTSDRETSIGADIRFSLNNGSSVEVKESSADLFSDFNPQEVLFSEEPDANSTVALPTFKAIYRIP